MTTPTQADRDAAAKRVREYIQAYEDAPNWGGPTLYPAPPAVKDLEALVAPLAHRAGSVSREDHADEYMSVSISRDGVITSHNAFDANFDEMVQATRSIIEQLQTRLDNYLKCPFASGKALRDEPTSPDARREAIEEVSRVAGMEDAARIVDEVLKPLLADDRPELKFAAIYLRSAGEKILSKAAAIRKLGEGR